MPIPDDNILPLDGLIETLELLIAQSRAYERALPIDNYPARAVAATLGELAQQALNETHNLMALLEGPEPEPPPFSRRELEVLTLASKGLTNKGIAYRLGLSERTIQFHLNAVFNKSGTNSRTHAVAVAIRSGWLDGNL